ncbi:Dolichyl-diphosphooligosaccharide--protein glycosyltransferase 48 kDa subunit [Thelohanellus kitauei]|uniref:Dolichyl-diphosphooligosaccharide--protein glycosyltransferase 48 kDa subunit n=1 Tax=Thelohanellus kitauei TaxID=669202 RepID=A0A0C2IMY2_THEKT|nr:Dolichyl-diphosphooligosaccharide--protein glycosyltransferase 48 kDa subunit [Thelohanellus kitauei]
MLMLSNSSVKLVQFGKTLYDHLCIITNQKDKWSITVPQILEFSDMGGSIFLIAGVDAGTEASGLINELGFIDRSDNFYADNFEQESSDHIQSLKTVAVDASKYLIKSNPIFEKAISTVYYQGRGFAYDRANPLTFPILTGSDTSFLTFPNFTIRKTPLALGSRIVLAGGVEMRNLARGVVVGSYHMFRDQSLFDPKTPETGNLNLFIGLSSWVFKKRGVLRIINPEHHLVSTGKPLDEYIVETEIEYSITVQELDQDGTWKPFQVNDMQLELVRLTTFGRVTYNSSNGVYTARLFTPDFIGIYGLRTYYHHTGYTTLDHQVKIIIRPRRHNDYQRFIFGAYPYYATAFLMMFFVFVLVFVLINLKSPKEKSA